MKIRNTYKPLTLLLFMCLNMKGIVWGQTSIKRYEFHLEKGPILETASSLSNSIINQSSYSGGTIRIGWQQQAPSVYTTLYKQPIYGLGYYFSTFQNSHIGNPNAIYGFLHVPWLRSNKWTWNYEIGLGVAYNFNPYNSESNAYNHMIGSPVNAYVHFNTNLEYALTNQISLGAGLGFKHFSNGSSAQPNSGINLFPISIYGTYTLDKRKPDYTKRSITPYIQNEQFGIYFAPGTKSFEAGEKNYFVSSLSFQYMHQFDYKIRLVMGFDLFYKSSGQVKVHSMESTFQKDFSYGAFGGLDWVLTERLYIHMGLGYYLKRQYNNEDMAPFYERIGPRYRVNNKFTLGLTLKAHYAAADYLEWTLGYTILNDPNKY